MINNYHQLMTDKTIKLRFHSSETSDGVLQTTEAAWNNQLQTHSNTRNQSDKSINPRMHIATSVLLLLMIILCDNMIPFHVLNL